MSGARVSCRHAPWRRAVRRLGASVCVALAACGSHGRVELTGAGGSFPYPVYQRWMADYEARTGVRINYQAIGSGGGIRQLVAGTVDFGATDVPMTARELSAAPARHIAHVPMLLGAVAVTYNLPGLARPLRLTPDVLADLLLARLTRWDDPRIAALNPGARLPARDVLLVHRAEASGTTYILTDYLSAVSPAWAAGPGRGKDVRWPSGVGAKGSEGVAGLVAQLPGALGYVETTYAEQRGLAVAELQNRAGAFVAPTPAAVAAAAAEVTRTLPATTDYRVSLVDPPGASAYPVASFTWLLLDTTRTDVGPREATAFARWALRDGASVARTLGYAAVPASVAARLDARLARIEQLAGAR